MSDWQMVPTVITPEMAKAFMMAVDVGDIIKFTHYGPYTAADIDPLPLPQKAWAAMLAVAPTRG